VLSAFCPVKWQFLRNRDFASTYILNLRKESLRLTRYLKKPLVVTP